MHYFINIGSNIGPRVLNISKATRAVEERFGYFEIFIKWNRNHGVSIPLMFSAT